MRKIKIFFLSLLTLLCVIFGVACGEVKPSGSYPLQLNDPNEYVLEDVSGYYAFGAEITLKIAFTSGVEVKPYLNDSEITNGELIEKHGTYYYEYTFRMPPRPSVLQISPPYDPDEDIDPLPPIAGMNTATFTVGYDYGMHQQTADGKGVATLLLNGCLPFFDFNDYNIAMPILAGDELTVYYTGEMWIEEIYPGEVCIGNGKVEWVEKSRHAEIMELVYDNGEISGKCYFSERPAYVINLDGTCTPIEEIEDGSVLYGAVVEEYISCTQGVMTEDGCIIQPDIMEIERRLTGLYSYHPDYTVSVGSLLPWVDNVNAENVTKITQRFYNPSVGPNDLVEIQQTTDANEIENWIEHLKNLSFRRISKAEGQIDGGAVAEYTITTVEGETYEYSTYAGNYYAKENYYRPSSSLPFLQGETYYQFPDILSSADLYVNGNFARRYENILTGITFKPIEWTEMGEIGQKLVLDNGSRQLIYVFAPNRFYIEDGSGTCYEIVGEKDFQRIFDDYVTGEGELILPTGQYALTVVGATNCLYKNPRGAYTPGTLVNVYADVVTDVDVVLYLNGTCLGSGQDGEADGRYLWKYSFVMPAKDSILYVNLEGGMLPAVETYDAFSANYVVSSSLIENEKPVYKLSTVEDMQEYLQGLAGCWDTEKAMRAACEKYDEEYFAKNDLIVLAFSSSSSSISYEAKSITIHHTNGKKTVITVDEILPDGGDGDCEMVQWHILIEIDKYAAIQEGNLTVEFI